MFKTVITLQALFMMAVGVLGADTRDYLCDRCTEWTNNPPPGGQWFRCNDCRTMDVTGAQYRSYNYPTGAWLCDLCYDQRDFKQCKGCTFYEDNPQQGGGDEGTQTQGTDGGGRRLRGRYIF